MLGPVGTVALVALVTLAGQRRVRAQTAASSETGDLAVHLELVAPAGCADESDLIHRISRRSRRIRFVPSGPGVREVRAELRVTNRSVTTTLTLRSPDRSGSSSRTVQAQNCDDAVEATALVAAVMLDPTALTAPIEELESTPDAGPRPSATASTSAPLPPFPPPPPPPHPPPPHPARPAPSVEGAVAFGYEIVVGPSPEAMAGPALEVDVRYDRDSILSPLLRVSVLYVWSDGVSTPAGTADFRLVAPRLELCPVRVGSSTISLYACGMAFVGAFTSGGTIGNSPAGDHRRPLEAFGGSLVAPIQLDRVRVTLGAAAGFVPFRDLYAVEDPVTHEAQVFHEVNTLAISGGLSLGVRFP